MRNFLLYLTAATVPCLPSLYADTDTREVAEGTPAATVYQTEATYGVPQLGDDFAGDGEGCYRYQPVADPEIDLKLCDVTVDPPDILTYKGDKYMWVNDTLANLGTSSICGLKFESDVMAQALVTLPTDIHQRPKTLPLKAGQTIRVSFLLPINPANLNPVKPEVADLWLADTWHKCEAVKATSATKATTTKTTTGAGIQTQSFNAAGPGTKATGGAMMDATTTELVTDSGGAKTGETIAPKATTSPAPNLRPWPLLLSALVVAVGTLMVTL